MAEDADEAAIEAAMKELKAKAEAMVDERKKGTDFEALCIQNASEEDKANYEDEETEYSLSEGRRYAGVASAISDWLFEEGRKEGDITALEDENSHRYYVAEFVDRYFDEADNESISNTIASQRTSEYMTGLMENYKVEDIKGDLKYLTVSENTDGDTNTDTDTETDTNATDETDTGSTDDSDTDTDTEEE